MDTLHLVPSHRIRKEDESFSVEYFLHGQHFGACGCRTPCTSGDVSDHQQLVLDVAFKVLPDAPEVAYPEKTRNRPLISNRPVRKLRPLSVRSWNGMTE